jgi:hypothetical protein
MMGQLTTWDTTIHTTSTAPSTPPILAQPIMEPLITILCLQTPTKMPIKALLRRATTPIMSPTQLRSINLHLLLSCQWILRININSLPPLIPLILSTSPLSPHSPIISPPTLPLSPPLPPLPNHLLPSLLFPLLAQRPFLIWMLPLSKSPIVTNDLPRTLSPVSALFFCNFIYIYILIFFFFFFDLFSGWQWNNKKTKSRRE